MILKLLLVFVFVASAQVSLADLLPGKYEFTGVSFAKTTAWKCQLGKWVRGQESQRQYNQARSLEIKKVGATLFADKGQKLQMVTYKNCHHYSGTFSNKYGKRSSSIVLQNGLPGFCELDGKIGRSTMSVKKNLPTFCDNGQKFETNELMFVYGFEVNRAGEVIWNPRPVQFTP